MVVTVGRWELTSWLLVLLFRLLHWCSSSSYPRILHGALEAGRVTGPQPMLMSGNQGSSGYFYLVSRFYPR